MLYLIDSLLLFVDEHKLHPPARECGMDVPNFILICGFVFFEIQTMKTWLSTGMLCYLFGKFGANT